MSSRDVQLEAIYARIPKVACTGQCFESCCFIGTAVAERERLSDAAKPVPSMTDAPCPLLDFAGRCSAYALRPTVCRLYGVLPSLRCPHGCEPERWLTDEEGHALIAEAGAIA